MPTDPLYGKKFFEDHFGKLYYSFDHKGVHFIVLDETEIWRGVPYMTNGAVCGNWWHGTRLGTPEGFTVVEVSGGKLSTRYETYGFQKRCAG